MRPPTVSPSRVIIVHALGQAGFLATRRWAGGGFRLALPPEKPMRGAVIRLTEATDTAINCQDRTDLACRIFPACRLKRAFAEAPKRGASLFAAERHDKYQNLSGLCN